LQMKSPFFVNILNSVGEDAQEDEIAIYTLLAMLF
jgi:hypothetical protein